MKDSFKNLEIYTAVIHIFHTGCYICYQQKK